MVVDSTQHTLSIFVPNQNWRAQEKKGSEKVRFEKR